MTLGHQRFSLRGLGDASSSISGVSTTLEDVGNWMADETISGLPNYALIIGGFLLYQFFTSKVAPAGRSIAKSYKKAKRRRAKAKALKTQEVTP